MYLVASFERDVENAIKFNGAKSFEGAIFELYRVYCTKAQEEDKKKGGHKLAKLPGGARKKEGGRTLQKTNSVNSTASNDGFEHVDEDDKKEAEVSDIIEAKQVIQGMYDVSYKLVAAK